VVLAVTTPPPPEGAPVLISTTATMPAQNMTVKINPRIDAIGTQPCFGINLPVRIKHPTRRVER